MLKADDGVVVELAHDVEGGPVLRVFVPLALHAARHHAHHTGAIREGDPSLQLKRHFLRVVRARALVYAFLELRQVRERRLYVVGEIPREAELAEHTEHKAERVSERGARLRLVAERNARVVRRAGQLRDLPAGGQREHLRAALPRLFEARERFLGVPRVARHDDERVAAHVRRQAVVAVDGHRDLEFVGEQRSREIAADGGAAHAGDDDAAHVAVRRWDGRFAGDRPCVEDLRWEVLDTAEHVAGIGGADALDGFDPRCVAVFCNCHGYAPFTICTPASSSGASSRSSFVSAYTRTSGSVPERRMRSHEPSSRKNFVPSFVSRCTIRATAWPASFSGATSRRLRIVRSFTAGYSAALKCRSRRR